MVRQLIFVLYCSGVWYPKPPPVLFILCAAFFWCVVPQTATNCLFFVRIFWCVVYPKPLPLFILCAAIFWCAVPQTASIFCVALLLVCGTPNRYHCSFFVLRYFGVRYPKPLPFFVLRYFWCVVPQTACIFCAALVLVCGTPNRCQLFFARLQMMPVVLCEAPNDI